MLCPDEVERGSPVRGLICRQKRVLIFCHDSDE
jgi:hypothetical protein